MENATKKRSSNKITSWFDNALLSFHVLYYIFRLRNPCLKILQFRLRLPSCMVCAFVNSGACCFQRPSLSTTQWVHILWWALICNLGCLKQHYPWPGGVKQLGKNPKIGGQDRHHTLFHLFSVHRSPVLRNHALRNLAPGLPNSYRFLVRNPRPSVFPGAISYIYT